jgi:plastocyanin
MESVQTDNKSKKKLILILIIGLVILVSLAVAIVLINKDRKTGEINGENNNAPSEVNANETDAAIEFNNSAEVVELEDDVIAQAIIPGSNLISEDNVVLTKDGQATRNDAPTMSEEAPQQTGFLNRDQLPEEVFQIEIQEGLITPNTFTTKAGAPTVFSLTGTDSYAHTIVFDSPLLSALAISVGPNQTKAISFNAPTEPGTYSFYCLSPGHAEKGETGEMIVQ